MGFSNISGCYSIHNYEQAQAHWDRTPAPKAKRRGTSIWSDNQRPLEDARKWHYRLERGTTIGSGIGAADYYDVCLYRTAMVRYWRPEADGSRRVDYTNHNSRLSKQFMWRMGFGPELALNLPGGAQVVAPVAYEELGTTIWRDEDGYLIKDKSHHAPVFKSVTSPEQKAWRKTLKESTRNLVTLFEMGMQLPAPDQAKGEGHNGAPFKGVSINWNTKQVLRFWNGEVYEATTHEQIEALKAVWDACLQFLVGRRDYAAEPPHWGRRETKAYKAPTPQEVTRSWYTQIEKLCCRESPASERIPDWPASLPGKYHF